MTIDAHYFSPTTPGAASFDVDVSSAIRLGSITGLAGEARLGSTGSGNIVLDDPGSTIGYLGDGILGLKQFYVNETACPVGNRRLWTGYIYDRRYRRRPRSSLILGADREIDVSLVDINNFLSFRVFAPEADDPTSSFVRPAETHLERVQALLGVDFISTTLADIGYIPTTGGVAMDAHDYTKQRPIDVLNDCAQAALWNFFVLYDEPTNQFVLWFDDWKTDGSSTAPYDSPLRLTNVNSERDSVTFPIAPDAEEVLDPSRLVAAAYGEGTGVTTYRTNPTTAHTFAWRDMVAPAFFVKTQANLNTLVDGYLVENSTEAATITCTVEIPAALVTSIHEGMRIQAHFTHLPLVNAGFTWCRILSRTIRQDKEIEEIYWLDLEVSPIPVVSEPCDDVTPEGFYGPIASPPYTTDVRNPLTPADGVTYYLRGGLTHPIAPSPGYFNDVHFPAEGPWYTRLDGDMPGGYTDFWSPGLGNFCRLLFVGDGTATLHFTYSTFSSGIPQTTVLVKAGYIDALGDFNSTTVFNELLTEAQHLEVVLNGTTNGSCINCIDIESSATGSNFFGWGGVDWEPAV